MGLAIWAATSGRHRAVRIPPANREDGHVTFDRFDHDGLTFTVHDHGPADAPIVVALHGFPQTAAQFAGIRPAVVDAGYRFVAPDQRGYSPGARPAGIRPYRQAALLSDVEALIDALVVSGDPGDSGHRKVHLVGHDWGGALAWAYAARHPDRLHSLTVLSTPHPAAFAKAVPRGQGWRSWYFLAFQVPVLPELAARLRDGAVFRRSLAATGMDTLAVNRALDLLADPATATAAVNWYRALRFGAPAAGRITTPTLYIWGDADRPLGRVAAEATGGYVDGTYRFEVVPGGTHWLAEQAPGLVTELLLAHLRAHR